MMSSHCQRNKNGDTAGHFPDSPRVSISSVLSHMAPSTPSRSVKRNGITRARQGEGQGVRVGPGGATSNILMPRKAGEAEPWVRVTWVQQKDFKERKA